MELISKIKKDNIFLPFLFGLIGILAFEPFGLKFLLFLSYGYLFYKLTYQEKNISFKTKISTLISWFIGHWLIGTSWIIVSIYYYGNTGLIISIILFLLLCCACFAFYFSPFLLLKFYKKKYPFKALLLFISVLTLIELGRNFFLGGFPWLRPGIIFNESILSFLLPVIGTTGASFLFYFLCFIFIRYIKINIYSLIVLILFGTMFQNNYYTKIDNENLTKVNFSLVQPSTDPFTKYDPKHLLSVEETLIDLSKSVPSNSEFIVWPEAPLPYPNSDLRFLNIIKQLKIPLVTGTWTYSGDNLHNSILSTSDDNLYNKVKLVPFGEYIPFERILRGLIDFFDLPMSQVRPGKNNITSLKVGDYIFSPFICFDISFENLFRKNIDKSSLFVINVSNDSWFGNSIGPYQHLEILKTRANENKIFILRATNDGISAVISNKGTIVDKIEKGESTVLNSYAYTGTERSFYNLFGYYIVFIVMFFCLIINFDTIKRIYESN